MLRTLAATSFSPFYTEHKESGRGQIAVTIEELGVSPLAHGVQTQQYLLEHLLCVELRLLLVKIQIFDFDVVVEFGQDRIILRPHLAEICFLRNAPFGIKAHQEDLDGVDLCCCKNPL